RAAGSDTSITMDPYLFQIGVTGLPNSDLSALERDIDDEIQRLHHEPVPVSELQRAVRQLEAQFVYSSEGVTNQAYWLGQWEIVDDWRRAESLPDEIRAVTAEDIQRVTQRYLQPEQRTVGLLEPMTVEAGGAPIPAREDQPLAHPKIWGLDGPRSPRGRATDTFRRDILQNGIPVLGQDRPESRSFALRVRIPAGVVWESGSESGIAFLTARALLRGFAGRTFEEISDRTDQLGSSITIDAGREFGEARVRGLREDFPELVGLLAQAVRQPDFPLQEVEKLRAEQQGAIAEADNDTRATADRIMRRGLYPDPNPFGRRVLGESASVATLSRDAVRRYHSRVFGPTGTTMAIVGGLSGFDRAVSVLSDAFGSWDGNARASAPENGLARNTAAVQAMEEIPGKSQADIAIGIATVPRGHPDYYALDLANLILGRLGLMGRLGAEVRDRQGLAYYAFSQLEPRRRGGLWSARAGVDPGDVERALAAIDAELTRLREDRVADTELEDGKSYLVGVLPLALETHDGVASTLLAIEEFGLGLDYLERYPDVIAQVSSDDIRDAAHKHLNPRLMSVGIARPSHS
ncbi:MAG: insulinase family protein, partial [Chloroflexi bacterium]|nr:insulinase family protein [Chloroflexota bacterium]